MENKYLKLIPKTLLNDFVNGRIIPFVGSGFSKNAELPYGLSMPDWNELGKLVASEIPDYEYDNNAIDALSYYENLYSRTKLVELLMEKMHFGIVQPGETYNAFCDLFTNTICTTNFDSLLEDSMTNLHRPVSIVVTEDRLTIGGNNDSKIVKLHGDFNHPNKMVITERDYDVYLNENSIFATYIANLFITNTMLLIGYSLDDSDFRSIWQIINNRLGNMAQPAYCIMVGASQEKIAKFKRRNINVINLEGKPQNYKTILCDLFKEIKGYINNEKDKVAKSADEKINEQLIIPPEDNKLCFISCAISRTAQLSALINPIFHNLGINPVRIDDMLMPGDNWIDVSRTTIRRSKAAIVDISDSSPNVSLELGEVMANKPKQNILLICEENVVLPVSLNDEKVLTYALDTTREEEIDFFETALRKWICEVFENKSDIYNNNEKPSLFIDARRLLEKREYSACVVSAYSELEYQISLQLKDFCMKDYGAYNHTFRLSQYLMRDSNANQKNASKQIRLRNDIVHKRRVATKKEALDFMDFVTDVYQISLKTLK